jgi:hypothetical protein
MSDLELPDLELQAWRGEWQAHTEVPADLRRQVERGTRQMRMMLAVEVLVTVTVGGGYTLWAALDPSVEMCVLAGATWLFLAAAWTFAIATRRGAWAPAAPTTAEFVRLSIRRARAKLAACRFAAWLYFAEVAFCLAWIYRVPTRRPVLPAAIFAVVTPVLLIALARYRRKTRVELENLLEFE